MRPFFLKPDDAMLDSAYLIRRVMTNYERAAAIRDTWRPVWQECYDLTLPELYRFGPTTMPGALRRGSLFDGTAPDAVDQLAASLLGQLTPPWVNWVGFAPGADITGPARDRLIDILYTTTNVLQDQIDQSNLHVELHQCFLDLVIGGTACLQLSENTVGAATAFIARAVPLHDVVLAEGHNGNLSNVYRIRLVERDVVMKREDEINPDTFLYLSSLPTQELEILEFCEEQDDGFLVGSLLMTDGGEPMVLSVMNRSASPFIVFRWMKTPGEAYGRSPVMKALPDIKTANKVVELVLKNASIAVTGIWQAEDDGVLNPANIELVPGAIIPKAVGSAGLKPLEMPARFDVSQLVLSDLRARICHALLADRFASIDSLRLTATEVRERSDEATLILGAIYGRLQSELLNPLVTYIYNLLRGRGVIADLPIDGQMVQMSHRSPLARAQSLRHLRQFGSWIEAVSRLGPEAVQTLNAPKITSYLAEIIGIPEDLLNVSVPSDQPQPFSQPLITNQGEQA